MEGKFLLEDIEESELDVAGQAIVAANISRRTIEGDVAQQVVFTRQKKLEESIKFWLKSCKNLFGGLVVRIKFNFAHDLKI